jgi:hypothetical protein
MRPRGLLAAVALLLVFEAFVSRRDWIWAREPCSDAGIVDAIEAVAVRGCAEPRVVFLGSSRLRDAIAPREFERHLGLPAGSVLNLGLTGGQPFDSDLLYRRNRDVLRRAALVVVGVEDWYLNVRIRPGERDRRFASFDERLHGYRWQQSAELLCGWLWRTYDARDALRRWLTGAGSADALPFSADGRVKWREETETGPETVDVVPAVEYYFRHCEVGDLRLRQFAELLDEIEGDGPRVAVIQVPWRDAYLAERERLAPQVGRAYEAALDALERSRPNTPFLLFGRASELGIAPNRFYDYGHLTTAGAREFTRIVAARLAGLRVQASAGPER